ncbi:MAG: hypothetical protein KME55_30035 [Nostoc indistinguendum CM1-VF10]|jgi:hypothetical protein|nr:hypothetical protein [Nostoc indistinguendum CM1-VF10]
MQTFQLIEDFEFLQNLLEKDENKIVLKWLFFLANQAGSEALEVVGNIIFQGNNASFSIAQNHIRNLINNIKSSIKPKVFF